MRHDYSLAHLTVLSLTPPQVVDVAARTGYRYVGLRVTRVTPDEVLYDLETDTFLVVAVRRGRSLGVWAEQAVRWRGFDAAAQRW